MEALYSAGFERLVSDMLAHPYWYLGRSAGFVSFALLWASVMLGLAVSSRIFDGLLGRPWVYELHRFLSIFVLVTVLFHALIMLPDPYAGFSLKELLVPFQSHYRNGALALGILSLYGLALVSGSFYVTKLIGQKTWRQVHYSTFLLFVGSTAHGIWAGTDSGRYAVQLFYLVAGVSVLFFTFYRVLALRSSKKEQRRKPAPPAAREPAGERAAAATASSPDGQASPALRQATQAMGD